MSCKNSMVSTGPHLHSPTYSATSFMGKSISNACQTFKATIWCGWSTIWTGYVTASSFLTPRLSHGRLSMISILPAPVSGNVYARLETYAAPGCYSRRRTLCGLRIWTSAVSLSPQEVPVMCTKGPSAIHRFASNASGYTPRTV
jgi:hypothetical protein